MFIVLILFLFCSVNILSAHGSHIHVQPNGGYTNVVIAISDRNIQSALLLKQLEDFLHEFSKNLQHVTNNKTFLHEVRILVPQSWNVSSYIPSTFENYYSADIHLDTFNPVQHRGNLYTQRAKECGGKGNFIYLNAQFLNDWNTTRDQSKVNEFVQEWVNLRYEILQYLIHDLPFFPYHSKNISRITDLSTSALDQHHRHNLCRQMHNYEKQVSSLLNQRHKHDQYSFPVKIQYVKLAPLKIVLVIDPNLCVNFATKGSQMLSLAIQKFLRDTEKNSRIGCVIADDRTTILDLDTRSPRSHFSQIRSMAKSVNIQKRNLTKGIEKGIAMFSHPSASFNHVIVFADGMSTQSFAALTTIREKYPHVNLFLITWTPTGKNLSQSSDLVKQFDYNFHKHFWMDIKMKSTIDECDADARNQVDEVFAFFFEKFQNDDFYPKKIQIATSKLQNQDSFVSPENNPRLIFEYNFCKIDIDNKVVNLQINASDYSDKLSQDGIINLLSSTYLWNDTSDKYPSVVTYKWTDYFNQNSSSSVWVYNENNTPTKHILNVEVRQKKLSQINTSHPLIVHAFSPNEYSVVAEIKSQSGKTFSIDLRDNGNGDPDVLAGDKIYSRYLLHPGADDFYSVTVLTKDFNGNVIMKTNVGSFSIPRGDKHPPNRIGDFRTEVLVIKQDKVTFLWTAPGGDHDHYSADKYYMKCSEAYKNVSDGFDPTSEEELSMTPKESGEMETYVWTRPSQTTVYHCVMMSVDFDGIFSEASNVNTVPVVSIDEQNSLLTGMVEFKIGLIIGGFVILVGLSLTVVRCVKKKAGASPTESRQFVEKDPPTLGGRDSGQRTAAA